MPEQVRHDNAPRLTQNLNPWTRVRRANYRETGDVKHFIESMAGSTSRAFSWPNTRILHTACKNLGSLSDTGEVVLIELNPPRNAGFYAVCPSVWMGAVRDWLLREGEDQSAAPLSS